MLHATNAHMHNNKSLKKQRQNTNASNMVDKSVKSTTGPHPGRLDNVVSLIHSRVIIVVSMTTSSRVKRLHPSSAQSCGTDCAGSQLIISNLRHHKLPASSRAVSSLAPTCASCCTVTLMLFTDVWYERLVTLQL